MPVWKKGGNLLVSEPANLKDMIEKDIAFVLIDLRPADVAAKAHIPGAVNIPASEIAGSKDRFPSDLAAPVILYGDNADKAFKTVRSWGFKETTALSGGLDAWKLAGGKVDAGKMETVISYVPKPRPGEISIEEFKAIAETGNGKSVILDVRDLDEAMNGMLKGAMNIPADKIKDRLSEVPKDKEIITHCTTGIRAEMAYEDLKENGYTNLRFLNAVIQIDKDGKYEITKK
ncbi:MAG: hypothetical protein HZB33_05905 [Nitrospirae bacterium]|nr:hypothetical protein [Nitrospirota bacterium]